MKRLLIIAIFLLSFAYALPLYCQLYNFTNYSLEQGLPQSTVFSTCNDSRGYLWIGTESGVARFNGAQFTVFDRSSGLPGNIVRSIIEVPNGNLWVGTDKGIGVFNGEDWSQITSEQGLKGSAITKLTIDSKGRIWAATNDFGVNIISTSGDSISISNISSNNDLTADFVLDIQHDSAGKTWLAMVGGVNMVTFKGNEPTIYNLEDSVALPSNLISSVDIDSEGNLWFGTLDAGAFQLKKSKGKYTIVPFNEKKGIADPRIWDVYCDGANGVWFGSNENGLYRWHSGAMQNITTKNGLPGNLILSISRDKNRNLWLGSMNGLSLFQGFHLVHYSTTDGLPGTQVLSVKNGADNSLWVGGDGKGLAKVWVNNSKLNAQYFGQSSGFTGAHVVSIDFDSEGTLLAGTRGNGVAVYKNGAFKYIKEFDGLASDYINVVFWNKFGSIYAGTDVGYNEIRGDKIFTISEENGLIHPEVQTVISDLKDNIWMGTMGGLVRFHPVSGNYRDFDEVEGLSDLRIHALAVDKLNQLYIGTSNGIYRYNTKADTITPFLSKELNSKTVNSLLFYNDTTLIVGTTLGFNKVFFDQNLLVPKKVVSYDKTNGFKFSETNLNAICSDLQNRVWFGTVNGLTSYQPELEDTLTQSPLVQITGIRLSFEAVNWKEKGDKISEWFNVPQELFLRYYQNHVTFDFDGIFLKNPERVRFRHKLVPDEKNWSPVSQNSSVTYPGLSDGNYTFMVSSSADGVNWSEPLEYHFTISPPFWKTIWFLISCVLTFFVTLVFYIRYREQKLKKEKEHLEQVVKERTAEVVAQKEHIEEQKEEITASITYARRIQQAILPGLNILSENTTDSFVLYKPRDIVSGDFYWIGKSDNKLVVAAADCTGHGVPGAFMSMLGISFMNKIIKEQKNDMPEAILGQMRSNVISSLKQGNYEGTTKDGMDMALCVIDLDTKIMTFSGAYNPAVVISGDEVFELKANRMPVGLHVVMDDFTPETIQLKKGDCVYLFSDGYQDQMGGPTNRKFMRKNLRELLVSIHSKPFCEQKEILDTTIENWRKNEGQPAPEISQMDDILVLGFSI